MARYAREVAVVAFAQSDHLRRTDELSEVEMVMPVLHRVLAATGLKAGEIGFTCSGSSDYLAGRAFSFTMTLDGVGAWPPISESHVEMDGAWALYEAWVKIQTGEADTALVYSYGKSSPGSVRDVLTRQLDPYYVAPSGPTRWHWPPSRPRPSSTRARPTSPPWPPSERAAEPPPRPTRTPS